MTIIIAILGLSFLIAIHEAGHMLAAKSMGVHVKEYAIGFGRPVLQKKFGKTVYSLRWILFGGFVKMRGMDDEEEGPDAYNSKAPWRRAFIIFAGPAVNIVAAVLIAFVVFAITPISGDPEPEVAAVVPGSLAEEVGLQEGDQLVSVNGESTPEWDQFQAVVSDQRPGDEVTFAIERSGEQEEYSGALTAAPGDPDRPLVGIQPVIERDLIAAFTQAVQFNVEIVTTLAWFIGQVVTGELSFQENVAGPVGIVSVTGQSVDQGFFFLFLAFISLQLGILNLLPILPFDGGHLLFIGAEKLRGRPIGRETLGKISLLGIVLLLVFVVFVTVGDVGNLISGEPIIPEEPR